MKEVFIVVLESYNERNELFSCLNIDAYLTFDSAVKYIDDYVIEETKYGGKKIMCALDVQEEGYNVTVLRKNETMIRLMVSKIFIRERAQNKGSFFFAFRTVSLVQGGVLYGY